MLRTQRRRPDCLAMPRAFLSIMGAYGSNGDGMERRRSLTRGGMRLVSSMAGWDARPLCRKEGYVPKGRTRTERGVGE